MKKFLEFLDAHNGFIMVILTLVVSIFSILLSRKTIELAAIQERPYVFAVAPASVALLGQDNRIDLHDYGQSPAVGVCARIEAMAVPAHGPSAKRRAKLRNAVLNCNNAGQEQKFFTVAPIPPATAQPVLVHNLRAARADYDGPKKWLYLIGDVTYQSLSGQHFSNSFCFRAPPQSASGPRATFHACLLGNQ